MKQKFHRGNVVHIAKNLGSSMSHFESDRDVVIIGSYCDQYHHHSVPPVDGRCVGSNGHSYTVLFFTGGECSWYSEHQLTLISNGGEHEIDEIKMIDVVRKAQETDMAWIVSKWPDIRENVPGHTAAYLMDRVGIKEPWGSQGEGLAYFYNWRQTFLRLDPILLNHSVIEVGFAQREAPAQRETPKASHWAKPSKWKNS